MCGIAGVVSTDPRERDAELVRTMLDALHHRGPDEEGLASQRQATLGVRRLSIVDVAHGHQPMLNETGEILAIQNGEIYNYKLLRDDLIRLGHRFRTESDTEILPHAYEEWGPQFVRRLRGMFALAVWDGPQRLLLLARDRFGEKPLLYAHSAGRMIFGSEIQALLKHPALSRTIDDVAIAQYLSLGYVPAPRSAFSAIRKLPAGHLLTLHDGHCVVERYWVPKFAPKLTITRQDAADETRRLIEDAVRVRLMSEVPLGAFLSGGLDSSTIVAFMARHSAQPVKTFSIGFGDSRLDELNYARVTAEAFGTDHHEFIVDASALPVLPMLVRHLGEPFADPSIVPTYYVARMTRTEVTVALTGDGGDELFAGYDRYKVAALMDVAADRLPTALLRGLATLTESMPLRAMPRSLRRARRLLTRLGLSPEDRHLRWTGYLTGGTRDAILGERLMPHGTGLAPDRLQDAAARTGATNATEVYMAIDMLNYLPDDLLMKVDIATMANSLESRAPLLDHELVDFVGQVPAAHKLSLRTSKLLLRRAMKGLLPDRILKRGKMGFTPPVNEWLRGPLRETLEEFSRSSKAADSGFVSKPAMRQLLDEHWGERADHSLLLWALLMLELWLREFNDGSGANVGANAVSARS